MEVERRPKSQCHYATHSRHKVAPLLPVTMLLQSGDKPFQDSEIAVSNIDEKSAQSRTEHPSPRAPRHRDGQRDGLARRGWPAIRTKRIASRAQWERLDSNQRRQSQRVYSPSPLTARAHSQHPLRDGGILPHLTHLATRQVRCRIPSPHDYPTQSRRACASGNDSRRLSVLFSI